VGCAENGGVTALLCACCRCSLVSVSLSISYTSIRTYTGRERKSQENGLPGFFGGSCFVVLVVVVPDL
jgi:hypothetical protein